ncbi:protein phosphatase regulator BUD14 NDAI_0G01770 [Naumovozyma dairenensis CBS 421]|uniref:SH3 domain-containing protein n=1 Tax=Naumovozyma dairenensis (strain ATCC 10597 / BCRC 20456 / CBS 421 / NBRC 0211 / NRRL Y-12639) TaxID=1071378 RepID=G0WDU2_NAUDC|nr:hypothetical protein NDAI_0G01770 [Naumovozyma dairenensis CBS 421]CCD25953.2 hypothetical protein NDAI_0G01770 [Naumovozyma dairenensis CBS 421]
MSYDGIKSKSIAASSNVIRIPPILDMSFLNDTSNNRIDEAQDKLLHDPTLVENYSDVLKTKPESRFIKSSDDDSSSAAGSVVLTPTASSDISPSKLQRSSILSTSSSRYSMQANIKEDKETTNVNESHQPAGYDPIMEEEDKIEEEHIETSNIDREESDSDEDNNRNDYDYSDSDFEDNLEQRLHKLNSSLSDNNTDDELHPEQYTNDLERTHSQLHETLHDNDDDDVYKDLELALSADEDEENESDEEGMEEEYQPLPPPQELDPEKLYALYAFKGPDSSHCQLEQDEACILLNDQDSYWWLIKRCNDGKIGFAPAEILETFPERLARLNCWKNENMSSRSLDLTTSDNVVAADTLTVKESPNEHLNKDPELEKKDTKLSESSREVNKDALSILKAYKKGNKSVSFNDVISYADRFIEEHNTENEINEELSGVTHHDEFSQERLDFNDDISDTVSDVSFTTGNASPLNIKKTRQPVEEVKRIPSAFAENNSDEDIESTEKLSLTEDIHAGLTDQDKQDGKPESKDDLKKIFEAPVLPFGSTASATDKIQNSTSDYSISSIGEFSPSSSERTEDSPNMPSGEFSKPSSAAVIPTLRAVQDISKFVKNEDGIDTNSIEKTLIEGDGENKSEADIDAASLTSSDIDNDHAEAMLDADICEQNSKSSLVSSTSEGIFMDSQKAQSTTSINSTFSMAKEKLDLNTNRQDIVEKALAIDDSEPHEIIKNLYNPLFNKMDDLLQQLDKIIQS